MTRIARKKSNGLATLTLYNHRDSGSYLTCSLVPFPLHPVLVLSVTTLQIYRMDVSSLLQVLMASFITVRWVIQIQFHFSLIANQVSKWASDSSKTLVYEHQWPEKHFNKKFPTPIKQHNSCILIRRLKFWHIFCFLCIFKPSYWFNFSILMFWG